MPKTLGVSSPLVKWDPTPVCAYSAADFVTVASCQGPVIADNARGDNQCR